MDARLRGHDGMRLFTFMDTRLRGHDAGRLFTFMDARLRGHDGMRCYFDGGPPIDITGMHLFKHHVIPA